MNKFDTDYEKFDSVHDMLVALADDPYERGLWRLKKFIPRRRPARRQTLFKLGYRWEYYLTHPWAWVHDLYKEVGQCIHRGLYGYSQRDVWNIYYYLCEWLPSALREMAHGNVGCPPQLLKDKECEAWSAILIEIAEGFEFFRQYDESHWGAPLDQQQELFEEAHKRIAKSLLLMAQWFPHLWD